MNQFLNALSTCFHFDTLAFVIMALVALVALTIGSFSLRYLRGDRQQAAFYLNLTALVPTIFLMVGADHLLLLLATWAISNGLLTRLMLHKTEWEAARQSALLARRNFILGIAFLAAAFLLFYQLTGETSLQAILATSMDPYWKITGCLLVLLAAMTQSALWPFHRWLTSSLNSPTPVSALMHAGLVNGGGFLLARFAPLYLKEPVLLNILFVAGMITALTGTLWKLMQTDIKRMLASSTMAQMGFMIVQCGLGLFPAAIAHLCWHGLFKANLFLASGAAAKEKRLDLDYPPAVKDLLIALFCGAIAACMFSLSSNKQPGVFDTELFLQFLALIAGAQFTLPIIRRNAKTGWITGIFAALLMGSFYGGSIYLIEQALVPVGISMPQELNLLHFLGAACLLISWLALLFIRPVKNQSYPDWLLKIYVRLLNASQPHPKTITTHRNSYQF
ncbi:proton-conducting transporter membrane subunit [Flavihumibacter sp. UBA7668]|uniref:proton-conducting transporter transmembrane domain-containing protein n=1 Tax=Flavihumibacter sp. UBA7668 TaxID=1946542 RepID=UPI0025B8C164|nr:proton-conducting transporter membrane subunit [Flavihumibacter sp. UBA7668]